MTTRCSLLALTALLTSTPALALEGIRSESESLEGRFELGPRLTHLRLRNAADDTLDLGGLGLYLRYRISRRFGVEGTLDALVADELSSTAPGDVQRVTSPLTLSALFYLFPDSRLQVYLLGGVGTAAHRVEYQALGQQVEYETVLVQVGVGAQLRLEDIRFDFSLRSLGMRTDADSVKTTGVALPAGVSYQPRTPDDQLQGAMMTLGVNWGW
ncbi:MAG: outer membrane beta-barrel protein [bacterium]